MPYAPQRGPGVVELAIHGLSTNLRVIIVCAALSTAVSLYARVTHGAFSVTLVPDLLFSALVEFALVNAMLGNPRMGGTGGRAVFGKYLVAYFVVAAAPTVAGALLGAFFATPEVGVFMVGLPLSVLSYSLLGTLFPAVCEGEPGEFGLAWRRGLRQAGFVLPRVIGFTVVIFLATLFSVLAFEEVSSRFFGDGSPVVFAPAGVLLDFLLRLLNLGLSAFIMAVLVVAFQRETPSRVFE
ncbi:MAG: hypothetical protein ACE5FS_10210 [Paracoccaceae bacterium]